MLSNAENYTQAITKGEASPGQEITQEDKANEAGEFKRLWEEFQLLKMDVREGSSWYVISCEWLAKWKEFIGYEVNETSSDARMEFEHPGMILNDDVIEEVPNILNDPINPHLNVNLKENLIEEDHYHIVNDKIWNFLYIRYGGKEIQRFGVKRNDESDQCIIEVNLLKLNIHYFPGQKQEDEHLYVVYESRYTTVEKLRARLARLKDKQENNVRLWKAPQPDDFEAFYRNNLVEFKKHREIMLNADLLKKGKKILNDIEFTMDDFLIIECRCQGGFIFEEIEKPKEDEHLNDNMDLEEVKDDLNDPSSMRFVNLDLETIFKKHSHRGLCGLSNLGNT